MRFCRECFENRVECQHGLEDLSPASVKKVKDQVALKRTFEDNISFSSSASVDAHCKDDEYQAKYIEHLFDSLMRSQCSITATSATVKVIVIRKEDKSFLSETLKQSIDRAILVQDFKDFDRPLPNFIEV